MRNRFAYLAAVLVAFPALSFAATQGPIAGATSATPGTWTFAVPAPTSPVPYVYNCFIQDAGTAPINIFFGAATAQTEGTIQPGQTLSFGSASAVQVSSATASVTYQGACY